MSRQDPLTRAEFDAAMATLGPFEASPHVAVAVSGGADSMALCLLADGWARRRGGQVTAITVDHGLRPGSAAEVVEVGRWMAVLGIAHRVLRWDGGKPATGVQAAARAERYRLMCGWCRKSGVIHLLLGHHLRDQAETVLMRLQRGSGVDGMAAMAGIVETSAVRLLRPLLAVPPARLRALLSARRQDWIDDPSNRDPAYLRSRLRAALPELAATGGAECTLAAMARRMGRARISLERAASALLARCCRMHPAGYARIDVVAMAAAPAEVSLRALARTLLCVGGRSYEPGTEKLKRLYARMVVDREKFSGTLGGCRLIGTDGGFLVCRETRGLPEPVVVASGDRLIWDGRFAVGFATAGGGAEKDIRLLPLGANGWSEVVGAWPDLRRHSVPRPAALSLPAFADDEGILNVPHLRYRRAGGDAREVEFVVAAFRPINAASGAGYFLA
jgi:tRNA(Ile)-lysidine synthase